MNIINSHNSWSRLEEVWLGDVYPESFYEHLEPEVRDVFQHITRITKEDLQIIQNKLEELGVVVRRPVYGSIENYIDQKGVLRKPSIMPRDYFLIFGNNLYCTNYDYTPDWQDTINKYKKCKYSNVKPVLYNWHMKNSIVGSHTIRAGKDLYIDFEFWNNDNGSIHDAFINQKLPSIGGQTLKDEFSNYRTHLIFNGGHIDATFAILRPGLILASTYYDQYHKTFPNWKTINCIAPEFAPEAQRTNEPHLNGKFFVPGLSSQSKSFNQYIIDHALEWVGSYTETYFELNCLVIDENNVLMLGNNEKLFTELEQHNITVHSLPFRTRTFWDGGLHCLTLDIRRQSTVEDYFPERGPSGSITVYNES